MGVTYETQGIVLKGAPLGESDRLITIFSPDYGLLRLVAPGARKPKSALRGRTEVLGVGRFWISQGRSLGRITQVEMGPGFPELGRDVGKLAAGQYLGEVILALAIAETNHGALYELFLEHLRRLAQEATPETVYGHVAQGVFHCLAAESFAPQLHRCPQSGKDIKPNFTDFRWRAGFSAALGGMVALPLPAGESRPCARLTAIEVFLFQALPQSTLLHPETDLPAIAQGQWRMGHWVTIERLMRHYAQYQLGKTFRAPPLMDSLWEGAF